MNEAAGHQVNPRPFRSPGDPDLDRVVADLDGLDVRQLAPARLEVTGGAEQPARLARAGQDPQAQLPFAVAKVQAVVAGGEAADHQVAVANLGGAGAVRQVAAAEHLEQRVRLVAEHRHRDRLSRERVDKARRDARPAPQLPATDHSARRGDLDVGELGERTELDAPALVGLEGDVDRVGEVAVDQPDVERQIGARLAGLAERVHDVVVAVAPEVERPDVIGLIDAVDHQLARRAEVDIRLTGERADPGLEGHRDRGEKLRNPEARGDLAAGRDLDVADSPCGR